MYTYVCSYYRYCHSTLCLAISLKHAYTCTVTGDNSGVRGGVRGAAGTPRIDEVVGECDITESAKRAATFKILRAIGIDLTHKQAYTMATLIEELRREQPLVDFANSVM